MEYMKFGVEWTGCDIVDTGIAVIVSVLYAVQCLYCMMCCMSYFVLIIQYNIILHTLMQWLLQKMYETLNSQTTPHISHLQSSYELPAVRILEKIYCVITALHCM